MSLGKNSESIRSGTSGLCSGRLRGRSHGCLLPPIVIWLSRCALVIICCCPTSSLIAEPDRSQPSLTAIAQALDQTPQIGAGKGTAKVTMVANDQREERIVDFSFKSDKSRSDVYSSMDNKKGELQIVWVNNNENGLTWNGKYARVERSAPRQFNRVAGADFAPSTFQRVPVTLQTLPEALEVLQHSEGKINMDVKDNGIVRIGFVAKDESSGAESDLTMDIDTRDGYRLTFFEDRTKNLTGAGSSHVIRYQIEWRKYGESYYPSTLVQDEETVSVIQKGQPTPPQKTSFHMETTVQDFAPNASIDDDNFTLQGLGLAPGTMVVDEVR